MNQSEIGKSQVSLEFYFYDHFQAEGGNENDNDEKRNTDDCSHLNGPDIFLFRINPTRICGTKECDEACYPLGYEGGL